MVKMRDYFDYRDGYLYWKSKVNSWTPVGKRAGTIRPDGYLDISINRKKHLAHVLIWVWHNGDIPDDMFIDHIDCNRLNNKIENLRLCTRSQNNQNALIRKDNSSGIKGVSLHKRTGKWQAHISVNSKLLYLGLFATKELAEEAITEARNIFHKDFANQG